MQTTLISIARIADTPQFVMTAMWVIFTTAISTICIRITWTKHVITVNATNPVQCTPQVHCEHTHGPNCGHEAVPHGDHVNYLVDGRLHHPHGRCSGDKHCNLCGGRYCWLSGIEPEPPDGQRA